MTETTFVKIHLSPRGDIGFAVESNAADCILINPCNRKDLIITLERLLKAAKENTYPFRVGDPPEMPDDVRNIIDPAEWENYIRTRPAACEKITGLDK
ncbi:MAG: hypothetical protein MSG64_06470 [Pyrinomonadaceae bacterium MAG19_C2-C3]|nr:hypothetical protein [Pyrinomonadaceae bacterium MAG19_C2-C3]